MEEIRVLVGVGTLHFVPMRQNGRPMSALGQKQTFGLFIAMSALPQKRTLVAATPMSALCQKQTHAPQQSTSSQNLAWRIASASTLEPF
jgi:hypothetical protein